ncbi:uncharacterized protein LOC112465270 isoform X2 [Temnothorax curvispinosus]|uniref:Uncharacterized protein LOC112465270 isoform X2 n=1 Tax=Temnothorax curvispinosus TaxID=300111 RepID=A0A6J1R6Q3_9HYME|nr:uncharacterized protein LOC112465270 isoform X2 [Temnothorax curvispinosus]
MRSAFLYVTLVQGQHQTLDGNHHQGQKEQDNVNCTVVSAESHAVDIRFSGETERSAMETAFVALGNGDSSTQCSDVDDDDDEEEETDVKEGSWITNLPVSPTIVQRQPAFATTNGDVVLPNSDQPTFGNVRVQKSRNVRLVNQTCYNSPVTIKQFVYTNLTPNQDASRASDNTSDLPTRKNNGTPNDGCIFPQNTKLNKVTQWFWTWKRAVLSCVITLILLAIVVPITVHFTHQSDASVPLEIPTSSNEESFLPSVRPTTGTTRSLPTPVPTRPSGTPSGTNTACKAPPQPQNGRWKLHRSQCSDGQDCDVPEGTKLGLGSHLVYFCDSGYKIRGLTDVSSIEGKWLNIPVCTAILCKALAASSIRSECLYNDDWISCKSPVPPKTKATLSCEKSYRPETNLLSGQKTNVRCNANGEWKPEPMRCVPDVRVPKPNNDTAADVSWAWS